MCPLNTASWSDKQLDELTDLLKSADHSPAAAFISKNFLCSGSRIMTDPSDTTLRVTVNTTDARAVDLGPGIFQHSNTISEVDTSQTINILDTIYGSWGTGEAAHGSLNRWSIICVKNSEISHTPALRWFVDDSVDPNTYAQQTTNTLINKAYYNITVVHGEYDTIPVVPDTPSGYWCIAEVYVPHSTVSIIQANIYDTGDPRGSQVVPSGGMTPNWTETSRVLRLEFLRELWEFYLTQPVAKTGTGITVTGDQDPISFPTEFENGCYSVFVIEASADGWNTPGNPGPTVYGSSAATKTGFKVSGMRITPTGPQYQAGLGFHWVAYGY